MSSGRTTQSRPLGIKLICGVEGAGMGIAVVFSLLLAFRIILQGEPALFVLISALLVLEGIHLIALYGLWSFTSWGWWMTVILHAFSGLHTVWTILVTEDDFVLAFSEFGLRQDIVRLILTVVILGYLYTQRTSHL